MINPGKLDRVCTVLDYTEKRGTAGGTIPERKPLFTFYAEKAEIGSRGFIAAGVTRDDVTAVFTTHYNDQLRSEQQFDCEGVRYEIMGPPREIGRREGTLLETRSVPVIE